MEEPPGEEPAAEADDGLSLAEQALDAKEKGNQALKSADLPLATEYYEKALTLFDKAMEDVPQAKILKNNEVVKYGDGGYGIVDTAYPQFGDYLIQDLGHGEVVKEKVGRYEEVPQRFLRKELKSIPQDLFELRLAVLQNLTLISLKLARASLKNDDWAEVVRSANEALSMDGRAPKALFRKATALVELKDMESAAKSLGIAYQETRGRDPEVMKLLEVVLAAKGKGKGRGKGKRGRGRGGFCSGFDRSCRDPDCDDPECTAELEPPDPPSDREDESGNEQLGSNDEEEAIIEEVLPDEPVIEEVTPPPKAHAEKRRPRDSQRESEEVIAPPNAHAEKRPPRGSQRESDPASSKGSGLTLQSVPLKVWAIIATVVLLVVGNAIMLMPSNTGSGAEL